MGMVVEGLRKIDRMDPGTDQPGYDWGHRINIPALALGGVAISCPHADMFPWGSNNLPGHAYLPCRTTPPEVSAHRKRLGSLVGRSPQNTIRKIAAPMLTPTVTCTSPRHFRLLADVKASGSVCIRLLGCVYKLTGVTLPLRQRLQGLRMLYVALTVLTASG